MITRILSPAPRALWQDVYQADPTAGISQSPAWLDAMCRMGPYTDASRAYSLSNGKQLILPMVRRKRSPQGWTMQASHPHAWGMGGLLASDPLEAADIAAVLEQVHAEPGLQTCIRPNPLQADIWDEGMDLAAGSDPDFRSTLLRVPRVSHILELDPDFDEVWMGRFKSTTRTAVRKAEKSNLTIESDTSGKLIPVFYDLLLQSFERWAEQQNKPTWMARKWSERRDPLHKFEKIDRLLGSTCKTWVAYKDGEPAAALLILQDRNTNYSRGAMNKALAGPTRANVLLQKLAIEEACQTGSRYYYMGETGESSSLAQFKERFGAQAHAYHEYRFERVPLTLSVRRVRSVAKRILGYREAGFHTGKDHRAKRPSDRAPVRSNSRLAKRLPDRAPAR